MPANQQVRFADRHRRLPELTCKHWCKRRPSFHAPRTIHADVPRDGDRLGFGKRVIEHFGKRVKAPAAFSGEIRHTAYTQGPPRGFDERLHGAVTQPVGRPDQGSVEPTNLRRLDAVGRSNIKIVGRQVRLRRLRGPNQVRVADTMRAI